MSVVVVELDGKKVRLVEDGEVIAEYKFSTVGDTIQAHLLAGFAVEAGERGR